MRLETLKLASEVGCDPRTAAKFLRGEPVRPLLGERLELARKALGLRSDPGPILASRAPSNEERAP